MGGYQNVYTSDYQTIRDAWRGIHHYFLLYNTERLRQALGYVTPAELYYGEGTECGNMEKKMSFPTFPHHGDDEDDVYILKKRAPKHNEILKIRS